MTSQLNLVDYLVLARTTDPDTSHDAARQAVPFVQTHEGRILRHLQSIAPEGANKDELADATGLDHIAVARRIKRLVETGQIMDSGDRRRTKTGRQAAVWVAT